jgi:splicing factor 3B subunit 2
MEGGETPSLYTILPERHNERIGAAMMGSAHTYDIPPPPPMGRGGPGRPPLPPSAPGGMDLGGVELALNPEEVDLMDTDAMQARAEAALRENQVSLKFFVIGPFSVKDDQATLPHALFNFVYI